MTGCTRFQVLTIHESAVADWYAIGWDYDGPSDRPGYCIISWRSGLTPVAPLSALTCDDEQVHLARAVAAFDQRAPA
jgi:hypothetical protein